MDQDRLLHKICHDKKINAKAMRQALILLCYSVLHEESRLNEVMTSNSGINDTSCAIPSYKR